MGTDPDHISPVSQFGTHFRLFELFCTKVSSFTDRRSTNIILPILLQEEILGHDTREAWETGHWSTTAIPSARKSLVKKCPHIITPVWWHAILFENDKQLEFFQVWDHRQLITSNTPCDSLLLKEIGSVTLLCTTYLALDCCEHLHISCGFLVPHI